MGQEAGPTIEKTFYRVHCVRRQSVSGLMPRKYYLLLSKLTIIYALKNSYSRLFRASKMLNNFMSFLCL